MEYTSDKISTEEFHKQPLPKMLNVLTILSIIGSVFQIIGGIVTYFTAKSNFDKKEEVLKQMNSPEAPGWAKSMTPDPDTYIDIVTKTYENRIPIVIITLVAAALCLYGALQMRKLKKQGFPIYSLGELLPVIANIALIGMSSISGVGMVGILIPIVFIALYFTQRKYLVH